jgi:hypothetical protein
MMKKAELDKLINTWIDKQYKIHGGYAYPTGAMSVMLAYLLAEDNTWSKEGIIKHIEEDLKDEEY